MKNSDNIFDNSQLTPAQKAELDKRYADYQNGVGKTFTWEETVAIMDKAAKKKKK